MRYGEKEILEFLRWAIRDTKGEKAKKLWDDYNDYKCRCESIPIEPLVMPTLKEIKEKQEYKTVYLLIATLANLCAATEERIIDLLTGDLWDEEEAGQIKRSA